jgi:acetyl esterase
MSREPTERDRQRQRFFAGTAAASFGALARVGRRMPPAAPTRHGIDVVRDVPFHPVGDGTLHLDVYRPADASGPRPAVLYLHGGGFRALSKDTHWLMGLAFARRGYVVFNVDYRLAPAHPFPAAWADAAAAWTWVLDNAAAYGADPARIAVAGESAGANLATALTIMSCYPRPEPFAAPVWAAGRVPDAVLPACGILQVTDPGRFSRRRRLRGPVRDVIEDIAPTVLGPGADPADVRLADPLLILEEEAPTRPLPPFFIPVGTADPLLDDSRRLAAAVTRHGAAAEARYYPGELHAFHALLWRRSARQCWRDMLAFTARHVPIEARDA